jgi:hypothetical protein
MLTDPARQCVELSTRSYKPTGPILRQVVAAAGSCNHKAKHAAGFGSTRQPDGRLDFTTRGGLAHPVETVEQPRSIAGCTTTTRRRPSPRRFSREARPWRQRWRGSRRRRLAQCWGGPDEYVEIA